MISHDEYIFCLCEMDKRVSLLDHGRKFLVGMEISSNGEQIGPASIEQWDYPFQPPENDEVLLYWEKNKNNYEGFERYALSCGIIRPLPLIEFRDRLTREEKVVLARSLSEDLDMYLAYEDLKALGEVDFESPRVQTILDCFVERGLFSEERKLSLIFG